jgi:S1-C subfamily serine protease
MSKIIPSLLSKGFYEHPLFGALGTDVDLDIAKALGLNQSKGFLVINVANSGSVNSSFVTQLK